MISYLIILIIASTGSALSCGPGVPILTRIPNDLGTYTVQFQCLCPIDYFGIQCKYHRKLSCYLTTKSVVPEFVDASNFKPNQQFNVTFGAQCYLEENNHKFISFINYFIRKQADRQNFQYQLESGREGGEIIWANDTTLLTSDGFAKYIQGYNYNLDHAGNKRLSETDERTVFYGNGPYQFKYQSQFLGFPLTDSKFSITSNLYKILKNKNLLPKQDLQFINYENYTNVLKEAIRKQEEAKQFYSKFSLSDFDLSNLNFDELKKALEDLRKEVNQYSKMDVIPLIRATITSNLNDDAQFGMLKAQFQIEEVYDQTFTRQISINSASVRIPIRVEGIGETTVYNNNFYKPPSRIAYFFVGIAVIGCLYAIYRIYKRQMAKKMKKIQIKIENEYEQNELS